MKVAGRTPRAAVDLVHGVLRQVLPKGEAANASVTPVFPGVKKGRRAGMLVVSLDDALPAPVVAELLHCLRDSEEVEYAEPASAKEPAPGERE